MEIRVVPNEYGTCPGCGAYWGHPDPALDFPNRQKVDNDWRCYNPACEVGYYNPETGRVVELKLSPDEEEALRERVQREVQDMMKGKVWKETRPNVFELVPEGE